MEVIILAGGLGTRLRSAIGNEIPKCMAPIDNKPFLWYLLRYLTRYDVSRVVLSVGYLREVIYKWVDDVRVDFPFLFEYAVEETPLGTGGGIREALKHCLNDNVVILNGDTFFDVDLVRLMNEHIRMDSYLTVALKSMRNFERYGAVELATDGHIIAFHEKTYCSAGLINGGVYVIDRVKLSMNEYPEKFSFETEVMEKQCEVGTLHGITSDGYFKDIGIPSDYIQANIDFKLSF